MRQVNRYIQSSVTFYTNHVIEHQQGALQKGLFMYTVLTDHISQPRDSTQLSIQCTIKSGNAHTARIDKHLLRVHP